MKRILYQKVILPVMNQLKQGVDLKTIVKSLIVGLLIGIFPLLGTTTVLTILIGHFLKLNHISIQITHYLATPLQLILIIPFYRLGEKLFGVTPISLNLMLILDSFKQDFFASILMYGATGLRGAVVWCLVSPILYLILFSIYKLYVFLKLTKSKKKKSNL